ncbi:MAG TPA: dihydropteroate synthase [Nitrospinae bacterium]|nr:dihydropteroate synthase [Nitrospinota bacterium]
MSSDSEFTIECERFRLELNERTRIMGILNLTPNSFYDGGKFINPADAIKYAVRMVEDGADIIDVGAESSRPGSDPISPDEEIERLKPVLSELSRLNVPISVDTYKSPVARWALDRGASIINDMSGFRFDSEMAKVVSEYKAPVVIMHTYGKPKTMQDNPQYKSLLNEISNYLKDSINMGIKAGISPDRFIVDPGIGFGKTVSHNLEILKGLSRLKELGSPILIGPSRKSFIGNILNLPPEKRLEGTAAAIAIGIMNGANIIRVHDVKEMVRVAKISDAIRSSKRLID